MLRSLLFLITAIFLMSVTVLVFLGWKSNYQLSAKAEAQTVTVQKSNIQSSITISGKISDSNSMDITTQATGIVDKVYVKNGDTVEEGQKIAELKPDQKTKRMQSELWAQYLSAKNSFNNVKASETFLKNQLTEAHHKFLNDAVARNLDHNDPSFVEQESLWKAAEAHYKNQQAVMDVSSANAASAWRAYNEYSSVITAPISGTVSNLPIPGILLKTEPSAPFSGSVPQNKIGTITIPGPLLATANVSEIDVTNISVDQEVTLSIEAYSNETFSGTIESIDTNGIDISGTIHYPVTISLEKKPENVYPNMSVTAAVTTGTKNDVLVIPVAAVESVSGKTFVHIVKDNSVQQIPVEVGIVTETQIEIETGLSEGDIVIAGSLFYSEENIFRSPLTTGLQIFGER